MTDNYYAASAYNSEHIPQDMPPQTHLAGKMPVFIRLPWGGSSDDAMYPTIFKRFTPRQLRQYKGTKRSYSYIGDERFGAFTHQYIRDDSIEGSSRFWMTMYGIGLFGVPFSLFIAFIMGLFEFYFKKEIAFYILVDNFAFMLKYFTFPTACCLIIGYIIYHYIPFLSRRPGRGSKWELNRQTGMVTNYTYKRKAPGNPVSADSVPFYECDGYLWSAPSRYGMTHTLVLGHRYSDRKFYVGDLFARAGMPSEVYDYWDFLQNYMDTSKPLPDIPVLEQFRPLDLVTAAYDKQTGRDPHYFLNMDNKTWRKVKKALGKPPTQIDGRHCLMQQNRVEYLEGHTWGPAYFDVEKDIENYKRFLAEKAAREQQEQDNRR